MIERELSHGERLLLRGVRLLALETCCRTARLMFEAHCGRAGAEAHALLTCFVQQVRAHGRRTIAMSAPNAGRVTSDEATLLAVFGCAQADDRRGLHERLSALLAAPAPLALAAAACGVAEILAFNGLILRPPPPPGGLLPPPRAYAATVCGRPEAART
jgi:hypothetical protein